MILLSLPYYPIYTFAKSLPALLFLALLALQSPAFAQQEQDTLYLELDMRAPIQEGWLDVESEEVGIRGDHAPLSWGTTYKAKAGSEHGFYKVAIPFSFEAESLSIFYKIKVDGTDNPYDGWQQGNNHVVTLRKGQTDTVKLAWQDQPPTPEPTITGNVERFEDFPSKELTERDLFIYLPPGYEKNTDRRYPVLYMHDGQMLFDASVNGQEWSMDEAAEKLIEAGEIEPLIIVGISNTENRMEEYTPTRQIWHYKMERVTDTNSSGRLKPLTGTFITETSDSIHFKARNDTLLAMIPGSDFWQSMIQENDSTFYLARAGITATFAVNGNDPAPSVSAHKPPMGGNGNLYGDFIIHEVKPFIDETLRTKPEAENTALGGSSLGGLITLHLGLKHPDIFGQLLVVSPSVWWDQRYILRNVQDMDQATGQPIWLYMGTAEGDAAVQNVKLLNQALLETGWTDEDLELVITPDAAHNERAWSQQSENMLKFLFSIQK